jgi:Peptidase family C54
MVMTSSNSIYSEYHPQPETLSALETLRLGAAHAYYSVSRALRFDKVASLLQRAELSLDLPVALLGHIYSPATQHNNNQIAAREVLSHLVHHFHSTPWMTYRSDFAPLPTGENKFLKTDAGWGCTLRSVQMIAAQTMIRHSLGADWRWPLDKDHVVHAEQATNLIGRPPSPPSPAVGVTEPPLELLEVLRLFWDVPEADSPFSIHNICYYGAECG